MQALRRALLAAVVILASPAVARGESYRYDAAGRLLQVTYADGSTIARAHDANGSVTCRIAVPSAAAAPGGDLNADGRVTVADAVAAAALVERCGRAYAAAADCAPDGVVDAGDVACLRQRALAEAER